MIFALQNNFLQLFTAGNSSNMLTLHMIAIIFLFLLFPIRSYTLISPNDGKSIFFNKAIGQSQCKCEKTTNSDHPILSDLPGDGAKLTCAGEDSLQAAIKALTLHPNLTFLEITITNSTTTTIDASSLKYFRILKYLSLSNNNISSISSGAFSSQKELEVLDLSYNKLAALSEEFEPLLHLKTLLLSHNKINSVDVKSFNNLPNLLFLDLSNNELPFVDCSWFSGVRSLKELFLDHNHISYLSNNFHNVNLHKLDLSFNHLKEIQNPTFFRLKNLHFLSLAVNELTTLTESAFQGNQHLEQVNLTGNMWICNRKMVLLREWLKKYEAYKEGAFCSEPAYLRNSTLQQGLEIVYLEIQIEESPTCNETMCNCTIDKDKLIIAVDCSNRGFDRLPEIIPYKTKVLNLHNNRIDSLSVDHINADMWSDVCFLYLNNNIIYSLKGLEGTWLLRNLVALHLSNNRLTEIPIHILEQIRGGSMDELFLTGNPWKCNCNTVHFQRWLQDNYRAVRNFNSISCSWDSGLYANQPIYQLKKSQLCPQNEETINYLDVLNSLMAIAIFLIIVKLSYDYWLQKRTGKLPRFFSLNLA